MIQQVSRVGLLVSLAVWSCPSVHGASVEVEFQLSTVNACGILGPDACHAAAVVSPAAGGTVIDGFVTTDADILGIRNWMVSPSQGVFNVAPPFGSDTAPPDPVLVALNRALEIDSWVTTPGETSAVVAGSLTPPPDWLSAMDGSFTAFSDETDDGPQDRFHFTRITFGPGFGGSMAGEIVVAGSAGPEFYPFSIVVPEPNAAMLLCVGVLVCAACQERRR